jgi:large subunit ribosomal protein L2
MHRIVLINYQDGVENHIFHPSEVLKVKETVLAAPNVSILIGNCLPFQSIPLGTSVHNAGINTWLWWTISKGGWLRSPNCSKEGNFVTLRLPSGEV